MVFNTNKQVEKPRNHQVLKFPLKWIPICLYNAKHENKLLEIVWGAKMGKRLSVKLREIQCSYKKNLYTDIVI